MWPSFIQPAEIWICRSSRKSHLFSVLSMQDYQGLSFSDLTVQQRCHPCLFWLVAPHLHLRFFCPSGQWSCHSLRHHTVSPLAQTESQHCPAEWSSPAQSPSSRCELAPAATATAAPDTSLQPSSRSAQLYAPYFFWACLTNKHYSLPANLN